MCPTDIFALPPWFLSVLDPSLISGLILTSHTIAGWVSTLWVRPGGGCRREEWSGLAMGVEGRGWMTLEPQSQWAGAGARQMAFSPLVQHPLFLTTAYPFIAGEFPLLPNSKYVNFHIKKKSWFCGSLCMDGAKQGSMYKEGRKRKWHLWCDCCMLGTIWGISHDFWYNLDNHLRHLLLYLFTDEETKT